MTVVVKLIVMLSSGLIVRHATLRIGRVMARRSTLRIPMLCGYATAGCTAGLAKLALTSWTSLSEVVVWVLFGSLWGTIAGLMLPFSVARSRARLSTGDL